MKTRKWMQFLIIVLLAVVAAACGSSSYKGQASDEDVIAMELGVEYQVFAGDRIEPLEAEEDVRISVRHVVGEGGEEKYVTLLTGSAELIRGT